MHVGLKHTWSCLRTSLNFKLVGMCDPGTAFSIIFPQENEIKNTQWEQFQLQPTCLLSWSHCVTGAGTLSSPGRAASKATSPLASARASSTSQRDTGPVPGKRGPGMAADHVSTEAPAAHSTFSPRHLLLQLLLRLKMNSPSHKMQPFPEVKRGKGRA